MIFGFRGRSRGASIPKIHGSYVRVSFDSNLLRSSSYAKPVRKHFTEFIARVLTDFECAGNWGWKLGDGGEG
ncbi:hypothetical protein WN48_08543 [Eufriesea mexicana]|uniref:Uncharacterized protein n=1 Tax=Eufriesea mexicana TaxID=516756 RepID=A0A310SFX6_9HYME|nr:hypothetical protein WN48_08543 [Eufriesea mexicana]